MNGYMSVFLQIENEKLGQVVTLLLKQVITMYQLIPLKIIFFLLQNDAQVYNK